MPLPRPQHQKSGIDIVSSSIDSPSGRSAVNQTLTTMTHIIKLKKNAMPMPKRRRSKWDWCHGDGNPGPL